MSPETLVLTGDDVRALLPVGDCIAAVEGAFRTHAAGSSTAGVLGVPVPGGGFHIKAATLGLDRAYFAAKLNGNFPGNPAQNGLPRIQGVVALCDGETGRLLALLDSIEITRLRTGAATAVAAKYLARPESTVLTLFGCGRQGSAQLDCLSRVLGLEQVFVSDPNPLAAQRLARWAGETLRLEATVLEGPEALRQARRSDVVVTCTPARKYFLTRNDVGPGSFVAAVGADDAGKQELEPELLAASTLVADVLEQCATIGELHHALVAGVLRREAVHAELAEVVAGSKRGRSDAQEITVFDSTGTALEDVAAAAVAYQRALADGRGLTVRLAGTIQGEQETI